LKDVLDHFELTNGWLLVNMTDIASPNFSMKRELQSTLNASPMQWPALRNHIPCIAHIIQLALGAFICRVAVKGHTKSWEAHGRNQQLEANESIYIVKSQRLRKDGNNRINKASALQLG